MNAMPPYSDYGYDSDEQEAIMEASAAAATCEQCGKQLKNEQALRIHIGRVHGKARPPAATAIPNGSGVGARGVMGASPTTSEVRTWVSGRGARASGRATRVDALVHELALALLDQALDEVRRKARAAL